MNPFKNALKTVFCLFAAKKTTVHIFHSERCSYREFGVHFRKKHPQLAQDLLMKDLDHLLSPAYQHYKMLINALETLPEFTAFYATTQNKDFFFAAFEQTDVTGSIKKTGAKDVQKFILERIRSQLQSPRPSYEFVVEKDGKVVGYVELFDHKALDGKKQCERGVFIVPEEQAHGYGKEAIIAMTDYAFKTLKIERVFTMVDPNNIRSVQNIIQNSGGVQFGEEESKYKHLHGGGVKRHLYYIYPQAFYAAIDAKNHHKYLASNDNIAKNNKKSAPKQKGHTP